MNEELQSLSKVIPANMPDWFLETLVNMVNGRELEFGITLNVSGFLVSGSLVSGDKYFEGFASDFAGAFSEQGVAEGIRSSISKFGDIYQVEGERNPDIPPPAFIHLKQARFFNTNGSPVPANGGVWWRGRLSEVSGFILGRLGVSDQ